MIVVGMRIGSRWAWLRNRKSTYLLELLDGSLVDTTALVDQVTGLDEDVSTLLATHPACEGRVKRLR